MIIRAFTAEELKGKSSWCYSHYGRAVWRSTNIPVDDRIYCKHCYKQYRDENGIRFYKLPKIANYQTPRDGTALSSPGKHLSGKRHGLVSQSSTQLDVIGRLNSGERPAINQKTFSALLTLFIVCCAQSFSLVEHPVFRLFISSVCPNSKYPPERQSRPAAWTGFIAICQLRFTDC